MERFVSVFQEAGSEEEALKKLSVVKESLAQNQKFQSLSPVEQQLFTDEFDRRTAHAAQVWKQTKQNPENEWSQSDPTAMEAYGDPSIDDMSNKPRLDLDGAPQSLGGLSEAGKIFWNDPRFEKIDPAKRYEVANRIVDKLVEKGSLPSDQADAVKQKVSTEVLAYNDMLGVEANPWIDPVSVLDVAGTAGFTTLGKAGVRLAGEAGSSSLTRGFTQALLNFKEPAIKASASEAARTAMAQSLGWGVSMLPVGMATELLAGDSPIGSLAVNVALTTAAGMITNPVEASFSKLSKVAQAAKEGRFKLLATEAKAAPFEKSLDTMSEKVGQAVDNPGIRLTEEVPPTLVPPAADAPATAGKVLEGKASTEPMEVLYGSDVSVPKVEKKFFGWNNPNPEEQALGKKAKPKTEQPVERIPGRPEFYKAPGEGSNLGLLAEDAYKIHPEAVRVLEAYGVSPVRANSGASYFSVDLVEDTLKSVRGNFFPGMDSSKVSSLLNDMASIERMRSAFRPVLNGSPFERSQAVVKALGANERVSTRVQELLENGATNEDLAKKMSGWPSLRKNGMTEAKLLDKLEEVMPGAKTLAKDLANKFGLDSNAEAGMYRAFSAMTKKLKTPIGVDPDLASLGKYFFVQDKIWVKDPRAIFHEIGHWAFDNILTTQDRLTFFDLLGTKYNSVQSWDKLFPFRVSFRNRIAQDLESKAIDEASFQRYTKWMDGPNEIFADMVSKYTNGNVIPTEDFKSLIDKVKSVAESWIKARFGKTKIPSEFESLVSKVYQNRVVEGFAVPSLKSREHAFASLHSSWRFIDKDTFMDSLKSSMDFEGTGDFPKADAYIASRLRELPPLNPENVGKFSDLVGEGRMSPEQLLETLQLKTHLWYHGVEPDNLQALDDLMQRVIHFAEPQRRQEVLEELRKSYGKVVESKYGRVQEAPDGVVMNEHDLRRAQRNVIQSEMENSSHMDSGAELAYKAFVKDLTEQYRVFEAMKLDRAAGDIPVVPQQLKEALEAERLFRFKEGSFYDDQGQVDHTALKSAIGRYLPSFSTLAAGITFDHEDGVYIPGIGNMRWSPEMYVTRFNGLAPAIGLYMLPGNKAKFQGMLAKVRDKAVSRVMESGSRFESMGVAAKRLYESSFVRAFRPTEGLDPELYAVKRDYDLSKRDYERRAAKLVTGYAKDFPLADREKISEILTKEGDYLSYAENLHAKAAEIREFKSQVRGLLIASGVPEEVLNKVDADTYLHRIYTRFGSGKDPETVKLTKIFKTIGADYLMPRGLTVSLNQKDQAFTELSHMAGSGGFKPGMKVYDFGSGNDRFFILPTEDRPLSSWMDGKTADSIYNHEWVVDKVSKGRLVLRRDYTKQERVDLGEVMDVVPRLYMFAKSVSQDIALGRAFNRINEMTSHVKDPKSLSAEDLLDLTRNGWTALGDKSVAGTEIKKFGSLSGKVVSPEVREIMTGLTQFRYESPITAEIFNKVKTITQAFKVGKTAFSPRTHGVNFMSNVMLTLLDGRNPVSILREGLTHSYKKTEQYMLAVEHGMIDSGLLRADFDLDAFMSNYDGISGSQFSQSRSFFSTMLDHTSRGLKKAARVPMYVYERGDQIFKMGTFAEEMKKHGDPQKAIEAANRLFFDYRDVPRGIQFVRDWGIAPFISYTYKIAPLIFDIARENPHRLLGMIAVFKLMNDAAFNSEYDDWQAGLQYESAVMPDHMKDRKAFNLTSGMARIPGAGGESPNGRRFGRYFDWARIVPGGDAMNPLQLTAQYPFGFHPIISTISGVLSNQDPYFDKRISRVAEQGLQTTGDKIQYAKDLGKFVVNVWAPNAPVLNPLSYQSDALGNMLTRYGLIPAEVADAAGWTGTDKYGTPDTAAETILGMFGANVKRMYPDEETTMQIKKTKWGLNQKKNTFKNMIRDARTSETELARAVSGLEEGQKAAVDQITRLGDLQSAATVRVPGISH